MRETWTAAELDQEATVRGALEDYYRDGKPAWDTCVTPPELVELVEGPEALAPGNALELGCGTGTNAVYLARHGWRVTALDLVERAVRQARGKVAAARVDVTVLCADATRLDEVGVPGPYDLFFDLSCYCGVPTHRRDAYAAGLTARAAPGARLLMFGYGPGVLDEHFSGVTEDELRARFTGWDVTDVTPGTNPFPTAWYTLRREQSPAGA